MATSLRDIGVKLLYCQQKNVQTCLHAVGKNPLYYKRRRPEETTLYQLVLEHVETEIGAGSPDFVKEEFEAKK